VRTLRGLRRAAAAAALAVLVAGAPPPGRAAEPGLRRIGVLRSGSTNPVLRLLVDTELDQGWTIGYLPNGELALLGYDLARLRPIAAVPVPDLTLASELAFVDSVNHRILFPAFSTDPSQAGCPSGPKEQTGITVFDILRRRFSLVPVPCTGADQFAARAVSYDPRSDRLLMVGMPWLEASVRSVPPVEAAPPFLVRQWRLGAPTVDWELGLRPAGCNSITNADGGAFVARHGDWVVGYCYGLQTGLSPRGEQGFAYLIRLRDGRPAPEGPGAPLVRTTPTLPDRLYPLHDPGSGRVLLLTEGPANGDAVWVYDPPEERFAGVIASGLPPSRDPAASIYFGIDERSGRVYFLSSAGLLVADVRRSPLPAGVSFPILVRDRRYPIGAPPGPFIAVAPRLRRVFVPVAAEQGWVVYEDDVPAPPDPPAPDPDRGTADVAETPGRTGRVFLGAAGAYGAHLLLTGGVRRLLLNQPGIDELCDETISPVPARVREALGGCVGEQLFSPGNRELLVAPSRVEVGSESGAVAEASAARFSSADSATNADLRRAGACLAEDLGARAGRPPPSPYLETCRAVYEALGAAGLDPRSGTRGPDGAGFPVPGVSCQDFGGGASRARRSGQVSRPATMVGTASVACDAAASTGEGAARAGIAVPGGGGAPLLAVAEATSSVRAVLTPQGIATTVAAVAAGVRIGDVTIGRVATAVTTVAHGRTGTAAVAFSRLISDVHGPGIDCLRCDPEAVVAALNRALGLRVRARLPEAMELASPRGFQAVAVKDPAQRDSDRTMNDDDTFEVAGLELVLYNDGSFGRSRLVVHLAGVRAESRYGIFLLPEERPGERVVTPLPPPSPPRVPVAQAPAQPPPGPSPGVRRILRILRVPGDLVAGGFGLVVSNPKEFVMLFGTWSLIAAPVALALRRRARRRALAP
jgi:hypothetical protein